jgi:hypothetical protein
LSSPLAQAQVDRPAIRFSTRPSKIPIYNAVSIALEAAVGKKLFSQIPVSMTFSEIRKIVDQSTEDSPFDLIPFGTGVLVEDPEEDIRFMVISKEGIRLPDPTGNLRKIVSKKGFNPQDVNAQLWDDAIIWPICHLSLGIWTNPNKIDLSMINISLPPTDLAWIGFK